MKHKPAIAAMTLILIVLAFCSIGLSVYIVWTKLTEPLPTQKQEEVIIPAMPQEESPTPVPTYACPETAWVDCMPGPDSSTKEGCTEAFLTWAKENCPNFQGAAY